MILVFQSLTSGIGTLLAVGRLVSRRHPSDGTGPIQACYEEGRGASGEERCHGPGGDGRGRSTPPTGADLMHEHVFVLTPDVQANYPEQWDEDAGWPTR